MGQWTCTHSCTQAKHAVTHPGGNASLQKHRSYLNGARGMEYDIRPRRAPQRKEDGNTYTFVKAVHDKVSTFEINIRKITLPLPAYIVTGALSDMRPVKLVTMEGEVVPYIHVKQKVLVAQVTFKSKTSKPPRIHYVVPGLSPETWGPEKFVCKKRKFGVGIKGLQLLLSPAITSFLNAQDSNSTGVTICFGNHDSRYPQENTLRYARRKVFCTVTFKTVGTKFLQTNTRKCKQHHKSCTETLSFFNSALLFGGSLLRPSPSHSLLRFRFVRSWRDYTSSLVAGEVSPAKRAPLSPSGSSVPTGCGVTSRDNRLERIVHSAASRTDCDVRWAAGVLPLRPNTAGTPGRTRSASGATHLRTSSELRKSGHHTAFCHRVYNYRGETADYSSSSRTRQRNSSTIGYSRMLERHPPINAWQHTPQPAAQPIGNVSQLQRPYRHEATPEPRTAANQREGHFCHADVMYLRFCGIIQKLTAVTKEKLNVVELRPYSSRYHDILQKRFAKFCSTIKCLKVNGSRYISSLHIAPRNDLAVVEILRLLATLPTLHRVCQLVRCACAQRLPRTSPHKGKFVNFVLLCVLCGLFGGKSVSNLIKSFQATLRTFLKQTVARITLTFTFRSTVGRKEDYICFESHASSLPVVPTRAMLLNALSFYNITLANRFARTSLTFSPPAASSLPEISRNFSVSALIKGCEPIWRQGAFIVRVVLFSTHYRSCATNFIAFNSLVLAVDDHLTAQNTQLARHTPKAPQALNFEGGEMHTQCSLQYADVKNYGCMTHSAGMQGRGKRGVPEKTRRPAVSSGTIPHAKIPGWPRRGWNPFRLGGRLVV
ncbi:hypothetical protein PR048_002406 [Dryococelus australis]|uniref:Ribosomal protein L2 n=1 Tax=Dryococelus australis TaxID=614101 RepID=A0ABQ9IK36_9NEOP|nr:hypothetical protein PR048_002406 [Dryococelus australis]